MLHTAGKFCRNPSLLFNNAEITLLLAFQKAKAIQWRVEWLNKGGICDRVAEQILQVSVLVTRRLS
jgi:hypothetical protein